MTQDKGHALLGTEISEPIPGADTLNGYNETLTIGGNGLEQGFWSGLQVAVQENVPVMAQNADIHTSGVQVDTAIKWMLSWCRIALRSPSSLVNLDFFPLPAYHWGMRRGRPQSLSSHWSGRPTRHISWPCTHLVEGGPPLTGGVAMPSDVKRKAPMIFPVLHLCLLLCPLEESEPVTDAGCSCCSPWGGDHLPGLRREPASLAERADPAGLLTPARGTPPRGCGSARER